MLIRNTLVATSLLLLSACGGSSNFVRPADNQIKLGETKRGEVVSLIKREADAVGQKTINNTLVDMMEYSFLTTDNNMSDTPSEEGFVAVKGQFYYLKNNVVVGRDYYSTFAEDSTKFDISKVASIVKGKTTKADVIKLFGNPQY